jgi:hypothetical protein
MWEIHNIYSIYKIHVLPSVFCIIVAYTSYSWFKTKFFLPVIETKKELTEDELYIQSRHTDFLNSFENSSLDQLNENIDDSIYDMKLYKSSISDPNNNLELSWKKRILEDTTPKGNIIMFYDIYKHAFTYYADSSISYALLNATAMKYVLRFLCRDFFIDNVVIPIGFTTPFLNIHNMDDSDKTKKGPKIDVNNGPFAKLKKYSNKDKDKDKDKDKEKDESYSVNYIKNKFIHLGKLNNYQKSDVDKKIDDVCKNMNMVDTKPMKYSDFKSWRNPSSSNEDTVNHFTVSS